MNAVTASALPSDIALPPGLRQSAALVRHFGSTSGPLRLGSWTSRAARGGRMTFDATFAIADTIHTASTTAYGPMEALTSMLYDVGFHLEILSFHQQPVAASGRIATFVLCEFDGRQQWSTAIAEDGMQSSIRALIGAANGLHG